MNYRVTHTTRYKYQEAVSQCHSLAHLLPRNTHFQRCDRATIRVNPLPTIGTDRNDYFGNKTFHFTLQEPHEVLQVTAISDVEIFAPRQSMSLDFGPSCGDVKAALAKLNEHENMQAHEFILDSPFVKASASLADYARSSFTETRPFFSCVRELNERIFEDFTYDPKFTDLATPLERVLKHRRGVCQDFAHLAIGCIRALGFPARYVSGYLETQPPPGTEKLQGADASHAWFSVYSPAEGWHDFDPTNNLMAAEQHITTAWGRDYSDVAPLKGTVLGGGASHELEVEVDVERLQA